MCCAFMKFAKITFISICHVEMVEIEKADTWLRQQPIVSFRESYRRIAHRADPAGFSVRRTTYNRFLVH